MQNISAAIVIRNNKILLEKHSPSERELFVTSIAGNIFHESIFKYDGGTINLIGIMTELLDTNFTLSAHDKVEWVQINELLSYKLATAGIPIAEKVSQIYG